MKRCSSSLLFWLYLIALKRLMVSWSSHYLRRYFLLSLIFRLREHRFSFHRNFLLDNGNDWGIITAFWHVCVVLWIDFWWYKRSTIFACRFLFLVILNTFIIGVATHTFYTAWCLTGCCTLPFTMVIRMIIDWNNLLLWMDISFTIRDHWIIDHHWILHWSFWCLTIKFILASLLNWLIFLHQVL